MPQVTLLSADQRLTKKFYADGTSEPYPLVKDFTSYVVNWDSLEEIFEILIASAGAGYCMQKGPLTIQLQGASRAGRIDNSANTQILILDYDCDTGFESFEHLLMDIDPALANTSYIFQHSASAGLFGRPLGLRGHAFFVLSEPVAPSILKQWTKQLNLTIAGLADNIRLATNGLSLRYPLDITINQNDKLIYLADPELPLDVPPPVEARFEFRKRAFKSYPLKTAVSTERNRVMEHAKIAQLRDALGLPVTAPKYEIISQGELLLNPTQCTVNGTRDCGTYVRLNLNGGDSWAYWYYKDNPVLLYNFKGEPIVKLQDVAPEYYAHIQQANSRRTIRPFVLRDPVIDMYYNGEYDQTRGEVTALYKAGSKDRLGDFMMTKGEPRPRVIEDWTLEFDPNQLEQINFESRWLNLFQPTEYLSASMRGVMNLNTPPHFPTIEKVIRHICVDTPTYEHFINWLAYIFQTRNKSQKAWVFAGTEGTGKGTLFHQILKPLFGIQHCHLIGQDQAMEQYNDYLRQNIILFYDEADMETTREADKVLAKFRTMITEPVIPIRSMRANVQHLRNHTNLIIASNQPIPVRIKDQDRRYNIAPRQNDKIDLRGQYHLIADELMAFAVYLHKFNVDADRAMTEVLQNEARKELIVNSRTNAEAFFLALDRGDISYFADELRINNDMPTLEYTIYAKIVRELIDHIDQDYLLLNEDMHRLYAYISGATLTPKAFTWLCSKHGVTFFRSTVGGQRGRYRRVKMKGRREDYAIVTEGKVSVGAEQFVLN